MLPIAVSLSQRNLGSGDEKEVHGERGESSIAASTASKRSGQGVRSIVRFKRVMVASGVMACVSE